MTVTLLLGVSFILWTFVNYIHMSQHKQIPKKLNVTLSSFYTFITWGGCQCKVLELSGNTTEYTRSGNGCAF
jgi:hypothetical protein